MTAGILVYNPSPGGTVSKPASNPKSDTAESAALALFLGAAVYAYTPARGMTARRGSPGS